MPILLETFLREVGAKAPPLSPTKLLAVGVLVLATGAGLFLDLRARFLPALPWVVMLAGLAIIATAWLARRRRLQLERELQDLAVRWDALAAGVLAAEAQGQSPARFLQAQGIRRYEIRRFLLQRLRAADGSGAEGRSAAASTDAWLPASLRSDGHGSRPYAEPPAGPKWLGLR